MFYRDEKALTYFDQPNRYALTDLNAPIVGNLLKFFTGVTQWAEVYYIPKRYLDGKFGSTQPYQFHRPDIRNCHAARLRGIQMEDFVS